MSEKWREYKVRPKWCRHKKEESPIGLSNYLWACFRCRIVWEPLGSQKESKVVPSDLKLEVWKSNMNQEERHYFRSNKGKGYQRHQYVFGYNPELVSEQSASLIWAIIEVDLATKKKS